MRPDRYVLVVLAALFFAAAPPAVADQNHDRIVERVLKHVNQQRAMNGAAPLAMNARLSDAAQKHADSVSSDPQTAAAKTPVEELEAPAVTQAPAPSDEVPAAATTPITPVAEPAPEPSGKSGKD